MLTEQQNPRTVNLDQMTPLEIVQAMNEEDASVARAVALVLPQIAAAVEAITARMRRGGRLFYIGAGTSGRLGVLDAVECVPTFGVPPELVVGIIAGGERAFVRAVEGAEDDADGGRRDLAAHNANALDCVVGIAASGSTPYVLGALEYANALGALTVGVSCNTEAPVTLRSEIGIEVAVGPEVLTGSTRLKAGSAQKMVLNMLSTAVMVGLGKVYGNLMVDVQITNAKLAARARRIVMQISGADEATADAALKGADGHAKTAIVMIARRVDAQEARELLAAHSGHLREIIG
ncbi:MAG: N-acetylmuramic acid 6-phosphate etherase [Chloroflexi bacterium]|nr:N-acetylmuramic acid 6-phosphate etherase [Chloroflexota bacterium]